MSFKRINLREMRKLYPDMPDACQRCQLFNQEGVKYREGKLRHNRGNVPLTILDTVSNLQHLDWADTSIQYCSAIQCSFPDELRTKEGKIPKTYVKYCSEFVKEDLDGVQVIATDGQAARESIELLGIDKQQDVIHLQYKSGEPNEYAKNRLDWIGEGNMLVSPNMINMHQLLDTIEHDLHSNSLIIGLDFEWNPHEPTKPHTIGIAYGDMCGYDSMGGGNRAFLRRIVANPNVTIVGHDLARAEIQRLFDMGIHDIRCKFEDSMTSTWEVMDKAGNVALKDLCYKHLPIENYWYDIDNESYKQFSPRLGEYCAKDAWASLYYMRELKREYAEEFKDMEYAHDLDMRMLLPTAYAMWKGIGLSGEHVQKRLVEARELVHEYEEYYKGLGINPSSTQQILSYVHKQFGVKLKSTDSKLLKAVRDTSNQDLQTFIDQLLEYRNYNTTITRYLTGDLVNTPDGIVHTYMQVAKANTGRPAYSNPNIANIPKPLRDIFQSTHGDKGTLVTYDRGQSEYRCIAYLSEHKGLIDAFTQGVDIHTYAANHVGIDRTPCKNLNFAYLYYAKDEMLKSLLREAGVKENMLDTKLHAFKDCMTSIREWQEDFIDYCYEIGYIPSPNGRRGHRLRPTTIVNYPVQSWSSDLNKETLLYFFNRMREEGLESHIWCEFYDGTEIDVAPGELPMIQQIASEVFTVLPDILNYGIELPFPLEETIHGRYWGKD